MKAEETIMFLVESEVRKVIQHLRAGIHLLIHSCHEYLVTNTTGQALPWGRPSPCPY